MARSTRRTLGLVLVVVVVSLVVGGCGRSAASDAADPAPPTTRLPVVLPWSGRAATATPLPILDAAPVAATGTAIAAALAPHPLHATGSVGAWRVTVLGSWIAALPAPPGRTERAAPLLLVDLVVTNASSSAMPWAWLRTAQTITVLTADQRYAALTPDRSGALGRHPEIRRRTTAACPAAAPDRLGSRLLRMLTAAEAGVVVPPRMPLRVVVPFLLPGDAGDGAGDLAAPAAADLAAQAGAAARGADGAASLMLQVRLPDGSARARFALAPEVAVMEPAEPADGRDPPPSALRSIDAPLDRAMARAAIWKAWEIQRVTLTTLAPSPEDPCVHGIGVTVDVINRERKGRTWNPAAWVVTAEGYYVPVHAARLVVDPTIPERITLWGAWSPVLGDPVALVLADGGDAAGLSIGEAHAQPVPVYPPTLTPLRTPTPVPPWIPD